jgi:hypothetical protein
MAENLQTYSVPEIPKGETPSYSGRVVDPNIVSSRNNIGNVQAAPLQTGAINNTPYPVIREPGPAFTGNAGSVMSPTQAQQIVNSVGINPGAVLSGQNIAQTVAGGTPAPDDLLGIRASLMQSTGANAAQAALQAARAASQAATAGLNERLTGLAGRPVSLSKITGQQAQERAVSSNEIARLQDAEKLALEDLQAKQEEVNTQFGIRESEITQKRALQSQYAGAGIKVTDSFDDAFKKISKFQENKEKDAYKNTLKEEARALGIKTSGLSTKQLEKKIGKGNKEALARVRAEHDLKMESMRADIAKTKSDMGKGESNMVPYYITQPDGTIQQAVNDDGSPVMIPKNSQIFNVKPNEGDLDLGGNNKQSTSWWDNPNTSIWKPWTWND